MIKSIEDNYQGKLNEEDEMKYIRDKEIVSYRKLERDRKFNKRRGGDYDKRLDTQQKKQECSYSKRKLIVDQRLRQDIQKFIQMKVNVQMISQFVHNIESQNIVLIHHGIIGIRKLLGNINPQPLEQIFQYEIQDYLISLASNKEYPQLRLEATWAIANILYGDAYYCDKMIEKGALDKLFQILLDQNGLIVEQAIWGIGNAACESISIRDRIINMGGLQKLTTICFQLEPVNTQHSSWAISNLIRGDPLPNFKIESVKNAVIALCCMIQSHCIKNQEVLSNVLFAIGYHGIKLAKELFILNQPDFLKAVIFYMSSQELRVKVAAMRVIGNVSVGQSNVLDILVQNKLINTLQQCLQAERQILRRQACWIISNLTAGQQRHALQIFCNQSLVNKLLQMLIWQQRSIQKEIIYIFSNLADHNQKIQIQQFYVKHGIIEAISNMLNDQDDKLILVALRNLFNILFYAQKRFGTNENIITQQFHRTKGSTYLQSLQLSQNKNIIYQTTKIIQGFFQTQPISRNQVYPL